MNVLSLFDGISCARVALERAGIKVNKYYASEIDKYAIQIAQKNYPDTIQEGDIKYISGSMFATKFDNTILSRIHLMIGGSPCQDLSIAKKNREGLKGCRSGLFYEFVRLLKEVKPKYFILENVNSMPKEAKAEITSQLWRIEPIMINAALVSAQNRKRLFWVGKLVGDKYEQVPITQPEDRGILLKDILEDGVSTEKSYCLPATYFKENTKSLEKRKKKGLIVLTKNGEEKMKSNTVRTSGKGSGINDKHNWDTIRIGQIGKGGQGDRVYSPEGKSVNLSANIRKLTPIECERLQSLSDNYTEGVSNTQRYKMLGNGMNVEVIRHILTFIK